MTRSWLSQNPRFSAASPPVHLNQVNVQSHLKGETRPFPRCIHFSHIEVFDIPRVGLSKPVNRISKATKRASSDRPHGTTLDIVAECYQALRRAIELSGELALGYDVVVAACPKSPRSKICKVQPEAWLVDIGSGHDLVDFALVLDSAQLIEPAHSNILLHTAYGECRPNGPIVMDVGPLNDMPQRWSSRISQTSLASGFVVWNMVTAFIGPVDIPHTLSLLLDFKLIA